MTDYTQGVCHDGAAILRDGEPMTPEEILAELRGVDAVVSQLRAERDEISRDYDIEHYHRLAIERSEQALAAYVGRFRGLSSEVPLMHSEDVCEELVHIANSAPETSLARQEFQARVEPWLLECFGEEIAADRQERNHRFLEEALELVQACDCTAAEAHKLVDYVFSRENGERHQEVGGVMVTLAALCLAQGLDMHRSGDDELARISKPEMVARIREKQKRKPSMSPLPGVYPERHQASEPNP